MTRDHEAHARKRPAAWMAVSLVCGLAACAGVTSTTRAAEGGEAAAYRLLADGSLRQGRPLPDAGFYVVGRLVNGQFVPEGPVQGVGRLAETGQAGWLELADGSCHPMQTGRPPRRPYVEGVCHDTGGLTPSSRAVVY